MSDWRSTSHPARLGEILEGDVVRCHLSPRNCTMKEGQHGFCGVRANQGGRLVTLNYGKGVHNTEETIETEAVNHYSPGEPILSLGNIGCMLNCSYCHNWKTSQARFVSDKDVHYYTPEDVVATAKRHGIRCLSWTYNDPVVWHEFVTDTARLAQKNGLINLFKSAFFITPEAVDELIPVMDIFSISIKSMDPVYYRKLTKGWIEPVLEVTKQVHKAGRHLEVSTLMVTDISDDEETARKVTEWVLTELGSPVPMHFVRYHPDYRMAQGQRTPIPRLYRAREIALEMGAEHVYVGNVYDTPYTNTFCRGCNAVLVTRYGLMARIVGLDARGHCVECGRDAHFKQLPTAPGRRTVEAIATEDINLRTFAWHGDIRSLHVQVKNTRSEPVEIYHRRRMATGWQPRWSVLSLLPGESYRFSLAKSQPDELELGVAIPHDIESNLHEVFDRAHFPTVALEEAVAPSDISPLPLFAAMIQRQPVVAQASAGIVSTMQPRQEEGAGAANDVSPLPQLAAMIQRQPVVAQASARVVSTMQPRQEAEPCSSGCAEHDMPTNRKAEAPPGLVIARGADCPSAPAAEGLTRRVMAYNDNLMLTEHTMEAGSVFPRHSHWHDQLAYLVSGHIEVWCDGHVFEARAGDSFVLRGGVEHQVRALERSVALDIFTPAREDYLPKSESARA